MFIIQRKSKEDLFILYSPKICSDEDIINVDDTYTCSRNSDTNKYKGSITLLASGRNTNFNH